MKKILPIEKPSISAFTHQCMVHAMLLPYNETKAWMNSNYIQIFCIKDLYGSEREGTLDFFYHFYGDFNFYEQYANPWILVNRLSRETVRDRWTDELSFARERVAKDEYVFGVINKKQAFGLDYDSFHPVLIYGVDDEKEILYCADNNKYGKYDFFTITWQDYLSGCNVSLYHDNYWGRPEGICTFKVRKRENEFSYQFHLEKVVQDLKEYLSPLKTSTIPYVYGIDCYEELCKYYTLVMGNHDKYCDVRAISSLLDHKVLMTQRLKYMEDNKYLPSNKSIEYRDTIEESVKIVQNKIVKYNVSGNSKILSDVIVELMAIKAKEREMLTSVITMLE